MQQGQLIMDTDASGYGIGGVLSQIQDGEEKVIAYTSQALSKSQRNYCTTKRELLAVVRAVHVFKAYIHRQPLIIHTNHASLTWLQGFKDAEGMLARWLMSISMLNIKEIVHRPGNKHGNADGLSRRVKPCGQQDCPDHHERDEGEQEEPHISVICRWPCHPLLEPVLGDSMAEEGDSGSENGKGSSLNEIHTATSLQPSCQAVTWSMTEAARTDDNQPSGTTGDGDHPAMESATPPQLEEPLRICLRKGPYFQKCAEED